MQKQENCRGKPKGEKNSGYRFRRQGGRSGIQCGRNGGGQCVRLLGRIFTEPEASSEEALETALLVSWFTGSAA
ncbi:MAG: hypothetical protein ACLSA0_23670 [Eisenbergiella massiliensis]